MRVVQRWQTISRSDRVFFAVVLAIFVIGIGLRSNRYFWDPISFWGDEAGWAERLLNRPLTAPSFRPIGYMALCRTLAEWFRVDERALRLPSYLGAVGSLFLVYGIGRRLFHRRIPLVLLLAVFALHPILVDFAKEFKPYALELFLHLLLVFVALRYRNSGRVRDLVWVLVLAPLSVLFAYNILFLYPVVFSLLGWEALRARQLRRLLALIGSAVTCLGVILVLRSLIWNHIPEKENDADFWARKYDVFYREGSRQAQLDWHVDKWEDLMAFGGVARKYWQPPAALEGRPARELAAVEKLSWVLLYVTGVVSLVRRRRWAELSLLVGPLLVVLAFNVARLWPWGAFRTNLFLVGYVLPMPFLGLQAWHGVGRKSRVASTALAALLYLVPPLAFGFGTMSVKRGWTQHNEMRHIFDRIREVRTQALQKEPNAPRERIFLDTYSCYVFRFYMKDQPEVRERHYEFFSKNFVWRCSMSGTRTLEAVKAYYRTPAWVIISRESYVPSMREKLSRLGDVLLDESPAYNHILMRIQSRGGKAR